MDTCRQKRMHNMGIDIGICMMEAERAACRPYREEIVKVHLSEEKGFEDVLEYDEKVDLDTAKGLFEDWDAFMKRNRLNAESDAAYMSKIKKDEDREILSGHVTRQCTGWVIMENVPESRRDAVLGACDGNKVTGWDMLAFDQMNEKCASCPLSWDKGRGCIGAYGPDTTKLPEIAEKYGCPIIASAPESAKTNRIFTKEDASKLLEECAVLKEKLPEEGKMMVRRYGGPVERLEAMAKACSEEGCGFFFF